jgi:hypothetical protein
MALTNLNAAPGWTQEGINSAQNGRFHIGALFPSAPGVTGMTGWRDGVILSTNQGGLNNVPNDLQVKAAGSPSLNLTVEAGHCLITVAGQGPFLCYLQTAGTVTLAAADAVNPRRDRIVAQIFDTGVGHSLAGQTPAIPSPGLLVIRAVTGTPAGSPALPALPAAAISLGDVFVAANDTTIVQGDITDIRRTAYNPAGVRTQLPGDTAVTDNGAVTGELRHTMGTTWPEVQLWDGTKWKPVGTPTYATSAARTTALGAGGQYYGQLSVVAPMIAAADGGGHWPIIPVAGAPAIRLRQTVAQSIPGSSVYVALTFTTEDILDVYANHDNAVNPSRITASVPGVYELTGAWNQLNSTGGNRFSEWFKNGVAIPASWSFYSAGTIGGMPFRSTLVRLEVGDYVEIKVAQDTAGALNTVVGGQQDPTMQAVWVRG